MCSMHGGNAAHGGNSLLTSCNLSTGQSNATLLLSACQGALYCHEGTAAAHCSPTLSMLLTAASPTSQQLLNSPVFLSTSVMTCPYTSLHSACAWLRSVLGSSTSVGWMFVGTAVLVKLMPDLRKILDTKSTFALVAHCEHQEATNHRPPVQEWAILKNHAVNDICVMQLYLRNDVLKVC